jgi:hypothetical protein
MGKQRIKYEISNFEKNEQRKQSNH